jgi:integrase
VRGAKPNGWPKYMKDKKTAAGVAYYWEPPSWARTGDNPCPVSHEALGMDYGAAVAKATRNNEIFDSWRLARRGIVQVVANRPSNLPGTIDWMVRQFQGHSKYLRRSKKTRDGYDSSLRLVCDFKLKGGARLGSRMATEVTAVVADRLYERLLQRRRTEVVDGVEVEVGPPMISAANAAMRAIRRAWNVVQRAEGNDLVPAVNPFARMELEAPDDDDETYPASIEELTAYVAAADRLGYPAHGTAAMVGYYWVQRAVDIVGRLSWTDYEPGRRIRVRHNKNNRLIWQSLADEDGTRLFPELEARLAETPQVGPLIIMHRPMRKRGGEQAPYQPYQMDTFKHISTRICAAANLPEECTFTSFRHGGLTEAGDAGGTDQELMAAGGHKTRQVLNRYTQRNNRQATALARKRFEWRQALGAGGKDAA